MNSAVIGTWSLVSASDVENGQLPVEGWQPGDVSEWLFNEDSNELIGKVKPQSGLKLRISTDDTFAEIKTGEPRFLCYDRDGVQEDRIIPFAGIVNYEGADGYLLLEEPSEEAISFDPVRAFRARCDDGDTVICDKVRLRDDLLVRTVSVVTDELYTERMLFIFGRESAE